MVRDGQPWFIDYQGGRRGALPYDLASLLLDAKANLPFAFRDQLKAQYLEAASALTPIDRPRFEEFYRGFSLIRLLQAMGAYGYRGFYERKTHFLQSVPYAIRNLERLLQDGGLPVALPALEEALQRIVASTRLREIAPVSAGLGLGVRIESFSYSAGLSGRRLRARRRFRLRLPGAAQSGPRGPLCRPHGTRSRGRRLARSSTRRSASFSPRSASCWSRRLQTTSNAISPISPWRSAAPGASTAACIAPRRSPGRCAAARESRWRSITARPSAGRRAADASFAGP